MLTESSMAAAILGRFINLIPQTYSIFAQGGNIAEIKQQFNPFVLKYTMTIEGREPPIDRRLLIAAGILIAAIEGRQD